MSKTTLIFLALSLILALAGSAFAVDPLFDTAVHYGAGDNPVFVFSADLDCDSDYDLAVVNHYSNNVSILKNNGDGTFILDDNYGAGAGVASVFSADLDGDGDYDLAVANNNSDDVSILLNNGDGTFVLDDNYDAGDQPYCVFSIDLDGDDDFDLAVANSLSDNVCILLNYGDGTFASAVNYDVGDGPYSIFSADLDGDGDYDLAVPNLNSDNVSILLNNGGGTFASAVNYSAGDGPRSVFSVDFDGDSDYDLVVANLYSGNISILKNNGDGTFASAVNYGAGDWPHSVFSADFDGDGDYDLAVANYSSDNVSLLLNYGDGTFASAVNYDAGTTPHSIFSADFDEDSDYDLVVTNIGSDNVSILMNLSGPYVVAVHLDIKPGSCPNPLNVRPVRPDIRVWDDETPTLAKIRPDSPQRYNPVLPVAILGTAEFDVADIDSASITLEGVPALRWSIEDVSTPVGEEAEECECNSLGADGYDDLTLKFDKSLIIAALGEIYVGDTIPLTINGELTDGTPFEGTDCVVIVGGPPPVAAANSGQPAEVVLLGNFPNPFNPTTEISFSLPTASHVKLEIFNVMGQQVATIIDRQMEAGEHIVQWDGSHAASGVYLYRLQADGFVDAKKMILLK